MASSALQPLAFGQDLVGRATALRTTVVDESAIAAFAAATFDERGLADAFRVSPTMFSVVPTGTSVIDAVQLMTGSRALPPSMLHMSHDIRIEAPIRPRQRLEAQAVIRGIKPRSSGVVVQLELETVEAGGPRVNMQTMTLFFRGAMGETAGNVTAHATESSEERTLSESFAALLDEDLTTRYAAASGDRNPIHLDDGAARAAGLSGRIVHGLCTLAICARGVALACAEGETSRLRRVAARFARPVFLGGSLTTDVWGGNGGAAWFEARTGDQTVVEHGIAHVADAWS